ncbi:MAG: WD40 repeat domain-containing protein, partial [Anaerolineae bacterium]|nr:WD40 repeat domain-containing protein [Anaerolineae bacterium]
GVGLLAGATWLSRLAGGWWWSLPWALAALVLGHAAWDLRRYSFGRAAGNFGLVLALLCLAIAIGAPALLPGYLEGRGWEWPRVTVPAFPTLIQVNARSGWQSLGTFLLAALRSVWGIFHIFTLFSLGYLWLRRGWGGAFALLILLFTIWLAGAGDSSVDETITHIFSTSPATWMREMLRFSAGQWGNIAWGILLTAFLTSVALVPVIRLFSKFSRIWSIRADSELTQSTMRAMTWALRMMNVRPLDSALATYVFLAVPFGLWVALWVALRQIAASGDLPLGFAYIPDLTVPHWKPVWSLRYYSLGLILGLAMIALQHLQRKYEPAFFFTLGCASDSFLFLGALLTVSIAPAGVTLFSIATTLSQILLFPTRVIGIPEIPILRPPIPTPTPGPSTPVTPTPIPIPEKHIAGSLVWKSPAPIAAMLEWQGARWFLCEDGDIVRQTETATQKFTLPILRGKAIFALKEDDDSLLVIGDGNQVLWWDRQSLKVVRSVALSRPTEAATLNPYKTMLAWVNATDGTAGILVLASGTEVVLLSGMNLSPALAFSADGRYLAVGGSDGAIHLVDMATRKVAETLYLPETSPSRGQAVRSLFGRPGGGWVSVYADRRIVLWSADHQIEKEMRPARRILALDFHAGTGRLALGQSDGILQAFNANLEKIYADTVHEEEITHVCFSQDGDQVFIIGDRTEVRKVSLWE